MILWILARVWNSVILGIVFLYHGLDFEDLGMEFGGFGSGADFADLHGVQ